MGNSNIILSDCKKEKFQEPLEMETKSTDILDPDLDSYKRICPHAFNEIFIKHTDKFNEDFTRSYFSFNCANCEMNLQSVNGLIEDEQKILIPMILNEIVVSNKYKGQILSESCLQPQSQIFDDDHQHQEQILVGWDESPIRKRTEKTLGDNNNSFDISQWKIEDIESPQKNWTFLKTFVIQDDNTKYMVNIEENEYNKTNEQISPRFSLFSDIKKINELNMLKKPIFN